VNHADMDTLIEQQLGAQVAGDAAAAVAGYAEDIEANTIAVTVGGSGLRDQPFILRSKGEARRYYECVFENRLTEAIVPTRSHYGDDFCITEHVWTGRSVGHFHFVVQDGAGRRAVAPMLNIWQFRDGLISRHDVWWDTIGVTAQLVTPEQLDLNAYVNGSGSYPQHSRDVEPTSPAEMDALIERHLAAVAACDTYGAVEMFTDDVDYDTVAFHRVGLLRGKSAARLFFECRSAQFENDVWVPVRTFHGDDFCVTEHKWTSSICGHFLPVPYGERQQVSDDTLLTVWEFRDGLISRHTLWLDAIGVIAQLTRDQRLEDTARQIREWSLRLRIADRAIRQATDRAAAGVGALATAA
jgi:hypothetical protein